MEIVVEFFGIPRHRAGCTSLPVQIVGDRVLLSTLLRQVAEQIPALAGQCIQSGRLLPGTLANIDGQRFVEQAEPEIVILPGQHILLMSADAGG